MNKLSKNNKRSFTKELLKGNMLNTLQLIVTCSPQKNIGGLLMKNLLNYLPGFRTNNKGNIIAASLYYAYCIYSIPGNLIGSIVMGVLPFIIFTAKDNSKSGKEKTIAKIKAQENNPVEFTVKPTPIVFTKKLSGVIAIVIITLLGFGGLSASAQNKKEAQLVIQQKAISDAKVKSDAINKAKADKKIADKKIADKKIADAKAIQDKKNAPWKAYRAWVDAQFSLWDGSHKGLVDLVKQNLNDKKSFEHDKTTYIDKGTYLIVKMTYRAKNGFGALILQNVTAKADYKTNQIIITSQND